VATTTQTFYIHKFEVWMNYGGPEEGGWWYDAGKPVEARLESFSDEEAAYARCRELNEAEHERAEREEEYDYTSVLAHYSTFYSYKVEEDPEPKPFPEYKPHYE
jgi:hypothetical protein